MDDHPLICDLRKQFGHILRDIVGCLALNYRQPRVIFVGEKLRVVIIEFLGET